MRCVLLTGRQDQGTESLVRSLRQRGVEVAIVHDSPTVMAELAVAGAGALIVHEPTKRRVKPLLAAVQCYYPAVLCRKFDHSGPKGRANLAPLTLSDQTNPQSAQIPEPSSTDDGSTPLVSREELAILLGNKPLREPNRS